MTVRKKPAPHCSRCSHNGVTWRELYGKRTWFCDLHLKEAENEAREAAAKRGVLPREMQSVTWEAIRALFPAAKKDALTPKVEAPPLKAVE